jgi:hypothetical protein
MATALFKSHIGASVPPRTIQIHSTLNHEICSNSAKRQPHPSMRCFKSRCDECCIVCDDTSPASGSLTCGPITRHLSLRPGKAQAPPHRHNSTTPQRHSSPRFSLLRTYVTVSIDNVAPVQLPRTVLPSRPVNTSWGGRPSAEVGTLRPYSCSFSFVALGA